MELYLVAESVCEHTNKTSNEDGYAATCTEPGMSDSFTCDDCGANFAAEEIPATGHTWANGKCENCGIDKPAGLEAVSQLTAGQYVIVAHTDNGSYALPTTIAQKMNGAKVTMDGELLLGMDDDSELPLWTIEPCGNGFSLYNGSKYLGWTSSTNFTAKDEAYEWTLNGSKLIITATESASTVRGLFFQIESNDTVFNRFGPYGTGNTTGYVQELSFYKYEAAPELPPVVEMDGVQYTSFEEAYANDPDTTIKLLVDFDEINVTGDLYLDLNGHTVGSVTANHIFAGDSSATAEAAGTGKLTTTSPVETTETIGSTKYVALKDENGVYTFHVLDLKLSAVTLRTNKAGIYYKAELACDEVLAEQIECYGIAVSILGMPTADFENEANTVATKLYGAPEGTFTSGSITNIFREGMSAEKNAARGEIAIYGNPYIQLKDETVLMGSNGTSKSMKDVMEYLNENFASLETAEQETVKAFYAQWADAMTAWNLENLAAAIIPTIPEEEEEQA